MNQNFIEDQLIILTKSILDIFLKQENPADLIALYTFYYYTAKWQKTNQPRATDDYCCNGLHWGFTRFRKAKNKLMELNLIEKIINRKNGKTESFYIKVNYIFKQETEQEVSKATNCKQSTNTLSTNKENALNDNNNLSKDKICSFKDKITTPIKKKKDIALLVKKIIDIFLEYNKDASKEKNYLIKNIKYTEIYANKYLKEYSSEDEFIDSWVNSLKPYTNNVLNLPKESSHYFNFPNKNALIPSNYLHHRNKKDYPIKKKKDKYLEYTSKLSDVLQIDKNDDIVGYINRLVSKNKEIKNYKIDKYTRDGIELDDNPDPDYNNVIRSLDGFISEYMYWLEEQLESSTFRFEYKFFESNFKYFSIWIYNKFDMLTFFPSNDIMKGKVEEYLERK